MEIIITGIITFISTNIDDIFMLMLFYGNKRFKEKEIIIGQLAGISALIAISLATSLIGLFIDKIYIGLLGFIPMYLGVKALWTLFKNNADEDDGPIETRADKNNVITVAGVTIANGGDNIGIYVPLFATIGWTSKISMVIIFLLMTLVWCLIAKYLTMYPYIAKAIDKYGHIVTPFILIALGIFILYESGSMTLLF
jgi:cadmium resistance transport/sequestration family protein